MIEEFYGCILGYSFTIEKKNSKFTWSVDHIDSLISSSSFLTEEEAINDLRDKLYEYVANQANSK